VKLILSRKGFDSSSGGVANPILPDGRLVPLPIPDAQAPISYDQIDSPVGKLGPLVEALTRGRVRGDRGAHLDPDLDHGARPRGKAWRPLFGQMGAAQGHLTKQGVGPGDLFLFFGWFKPIERHRGIWRFVKHAPDRHILYGWFQIDEVRNLSEGLPRKGSRLYEHPHCHGERGKNNTLYLARRRLALPGLNKRVPGAGLFPRLRDDLMLTRPGCNRAVWQLPGWFHPEGRDSCLSYHESLARWTRDGEHVILDAAKRGQEFVLDCDDYPEAVAWVSPLVAAAGALGCGPVGRVQKGQIGSST